MNILNHENQQKIKTYTKVSFDKIKVTYIFESVKIGGKTIKNFMLSSKGTGYTLNFLFLNDIGVTCFGSVFVENTPEKLEMFFNTFKIDKYYYDVNATKKQIGDKVSYTLDLGFSNPPEGLDLNSLKEKFTK